MLKAYPATQLFLISSAVLMTMILITPLVKEWYLVAALLESLKFVIKVICGLFLLGTIIDILDGIQFWKHRHSR